MKKIILLFCLSLMVLGSFAQYENSPDSKSNKELKKEQKEAEEELTIKSVERMVTNQEFYLEVTFMSNSQDRAMNEVSSQMNYLAIDAEKIILQIEPNNVITSNWFNDNLPQRGTVTNYKLTKPEKSTEGYHIQFQTFGEFASDITMTVSLSGKTELIIRKPTNSETLTFRGTLIPLDQTRFSSFL